MQCKLKKNLLYLTTFIKTYNPDLIYVQETGPTINLFIDYSSTNSTNTQTYYELQKLNYSTITKLGKNNYNTLTLIIKNNLKNSIEIIPNETEYNQIIDIYYPTKIKIINASIPHDEK